MTAGNATLGRGNGIAPRCAKREFVPLIPNSNLFRDKPDTILAKVKSWFDLAPFSNRDYGEKERDILIRMSL